MNKDDLLKTFSAVCNVLADNLDSYLLPQLDDEMEMITPIFEDVAISKIEEWWMINNHFPRYIAQIDELANDDPNSRVENIQEGVAALQENESLYSQFGSMLKASDQPQLTALKLLPHVANYAEEFKRTSGFKRLEAVCEARGNIVVWPIMTVHPDAKELENAYFLNVAIVSADGESLKAKLNQPVLG